MLDELLVNSTVIVPVLIWHNTAWTQGKNNTSFCREKQLLLGEEFRPEGQG